MKRLFWTTTLANVGVHGIGLLVTLAAIRPGTGVAADRIAYLASSPIGWQIGWGLWIVCALFLILWLEVAGRALGPEHAGTARLAVTLAAAGAACDLTCDVIHILVLPRLAATPGAEATFFAFDKVAVAGGLIVANGLYTLGCLALTTALKKHKWPFILGVLTTIAGLALAAAGFTGDPRHPEWAAGPTIVFYMLWTIVTTHVLTKT